MNLIVYQLRYTYGTMIERYHKGGYRTIGEFRSELIKSYRCDFVVVRESPGGHRSAEWEIRSHGKKYFYSYDFSKKTLKCMGVR